MAYTKREQIYDDEIAPLMTKIIAVCKENNIPMVFSAQLNDDREGRTDVNDDGEDLSGFLCTTILLGEKFPHAHPKLVQAAAAIRPRRASFAAYTITSESTTRVTGSDDGYDPLGAAKKT